MRKIFLVLLLIVLIVPAAIAVTTPQQSWNFRNFFSIFNAKNISVDNLTVKSIDLNGDARSVWPVGGTGGNSNDTLNQMFLNKSYGNNNTFAYQYNISDILKGLIGGNGIVYNPTTSTISATAMNGTSNTPNNQTIANAIDNTTIVRANNATWFNYSGLLMNYSGIITSSSSYPMNNQTIADAVLNTTIARTNQIMNNVTISNYLSNGSIIRAENTSWSRNLLSGSTGIVYDSSTGQISSTAVNGSSSNSITNISLTSTTYTGSLTSGSLTGYKAGNMLCNLSFNSAHLCTEFEVVTYIANYNINYLNQTDAWVIAGSPKYIPATVPVNDCNGYTYSRVTTYLGNYWHFNSETGGDGRALNCGTSMSLACCK